MKPTQCFKQPARQPGHLIGRWLVFIGISLELPRVDLRTGHATIEVDVVPWLSRDSRHVALLRLSRDLDRYRRGIVYGDQLRLAV